jgi:hypothetical protein
VQSFSDVSHLLTHINSKGHLAQENKLRVQSFKDVNASVQLSDFQQWQAQNNILAQLSERQEMKEAKAIKRARKESVAPDSKPIGLIQQDDAVESSPVRNVTRNRARNRAKRAKKQQANDEENEPNADYSPIQGIT